MTKRKVDKIQGNGVIVSYECRISSAIFQLFGSSDRDSESKSSRNHAEYRAWQSMFGAPVDLLELNAFEGMRIEFARSKLLHEGEKGRNERTEEAV